MSNKLKYFLFGGLSLIILAALLADFVFYKPPPITSTKKLTTDTISPGTIIDTLEAKIKSKLPLLQAAALDGDNTIGYQLPGYSFQVILPTKYSFSLTESNSSNTTDIQAGLSLAKNYLFQQKFIVTSSNSSSALSSESTFYKSQTVLCQLTAADSLDVTCASSNYIQSIASQAAPLVSLYALASGSSTNSISAPSFKASQTAGYSLAIMDIYNGSGETKINYYKTSSGAWNMIDLSWYNDPHEDANITPNCEDFESVADIRAAYQGVACYDSSFRIMSTIK